MSEHELWNELGNLYFVSGLFDQAVYAYNRSVLLDASYGRPYGNLGLVMAQKGKYQEAISFYKKGLELISDIHEKAICLNKLGNIYRHLGNYDAAFQSYQQADEYDLETGLWHQRNELLPFVDGAMPRSLEELLEILTGQEKITEKALLPENVSPPEILDAQVLQVVEDEVEVFSNDSLFAAFAVADVQAPCMERSCEDAGVDMHQCWPILLPAGTATADTSPASIQPAITPAWNFMSREMQLLRNKRQNVFRPETAQISKWIDQVLVEVEESSAPVYMVAPESPSLLVDEFVVDNPVIDAEIEVEREVGEEEEQPIDQVAHFRKQVEKNPRSTFVWASLGDACKEAKQYQEAINAYCQAVEIDKTNPSHSYQLGLVYAIVGNFEGAAEAFKTVLRLDPRNSLAHAGLAGYYHRMGLEELSKRHIDKAKREIYSNENEYNQACFEAICGNVEESLRLLEVALRERQSRVDWALRDPDLENVRDHPRFMELIQRFTKE